MGEHRHRCMAHRLHIISYFQKTDVEDGGHGVVDIPRGNNMGCRLEVTLADLLVAVIALFSGSGH